MGKAKTFTSAELRRVFDYLETRQHAIRNRAMVCVSHMGADSQEVWTAILYQSGFNSALQRTYEERLSRLSCGWKNDSE